MLSSYSMDLCSNLLPYCSFFFQAEGGIRDDLVTGVQTCALPILIFQGAMTLNQKSSSRVSLVAVGDNLIHNTIYEAQEPPYDFRENYSDFKEFVQGFDLAFINQETIKNGRASGRERRKDMESEL